MPMGVHRLEFRAHCSGIDDLPTIREALHILVPQDTKIDEKSERSWHGAPQTNITIELNRKADARRGLSMLGAEVLERLLEGNILDRIDERNVLHFRLDLAELCCGNKQISDARRREPCVKVQVKLEVYPGQSVKENAISCIENAINSQ